MKILRQETPSSMQSLKFNVSTIPELEIIEREIYTALSDSRGVIRDMCSHILSAGGKKIRPLLVIYSGLILSPITDELVQAAVAAELIHMASLVHDDIIDDSVLRRNRPSINKIWGNHFAVLCGDYLFAKAFSILSNSNLNKGMSLMVDAIQNMCHGEVLQAADRFNQEVSLEIYYEKIAKKTAIFLGCCSKTGAVIAGASEVQSQILGEYGLNLGLAFQIIDDILDFCGSSEIMGKPKCEDLCQGIITMPVILLKDDEKYGGWISELISKKEFTGQAVEDISAILKESGAISKSFEAATMHIQKAKQCLTLLPDSQYVEVLNNMADALEARMN